MSALHQLGLQQPHMHLHYLHPKQFLLTKVSEDHFYICKTSAVLEKLVHTVPSKSFEQQANLSLRSKDERKTSFMSAFIFWYLHVDVVNNVSYITIRNTLQHF